ncbi:MAG TPA: methylated-DNA--[protein]-cysteine S-methyltransferase [Thermoanaerobaculia bacterium]|nr:methylated-DNA--[protein]-cysteine S-methyltransferase [Thermoanaerobaculia bacterium]
MSDLRFALHRDALGFAYAVARGGSLVGLGHRPSLEEAEQSCARSWPGAVRDDAVRDDLAPPFPQLWDQLDEYLEGRRRSFDLPLAPAGTEFQRLCWQALREIPYGQTRSYSEQARLIGRPAAIRAVGRANHDNPIGVVIPCHRVIGANGHLTGYAGGLPMKRLLLELEGVLTKSLAL